MSQVTKNCNFFSIYVFIFVNTQGGWVKPDFNQVSQPSSSKTQKRATSFPKTKAKVKVDVIKLWVNKHKAESIEELVVQKKKIADVKQWLQQAFTPGLMASLSNISFAKV